MSQEQIDALKRGFESFNRGDWDAALEGFAEDVVQTAYFAPVTGERSLHGRAALKRAWEAASEVFGGGGTYRVEPQDFRDLGGGVILVPVRLSGRGRASGVETETELAQLWTFRQGRVVRIDQYADVTEALEATGLLE
jgi:ketosteroid isomerase-like protein